MVLGRNSRCDEDGGQNRETEETSRKLFVCFKSFFLRGTESETVKGPGSSGGKSHLLCIFLEMKCLTCGKQNYGERLVS